MVNLIIRISWDVVALSHTREYTYDPGFDVETLVSPSLAKDGRAEEHIHGTAIPSQAIQTSDSDYGSGLV